MSQKEILKILSGSRDRNLRFKVLRSVLLSFGFSERIKGSHHIFTKPGIEEILNLQPKKDMAKPYQIKQVRNVILKYKLFVDE